MVGGDAAPFGGDAAGLDDDDVDAERRDLDSQAVAEHLEGELRAVIPPAERGVELASHGGDVHDRPGAMRAHVRQRQLGEPDRAEHVDLELAAALVDLDVFQCAVRAVAGVVDQHVDAAGLLDDARYAVLHGLVVRDVHRQWVDAVLGELLEPV